MTKHVNLRLPDDVHEMAVAASAADDRSLNSWLVAVVRRATMDAKVNDPNPVHDSSRGDEEEV
jgi:hypothetical protein